MVVYSKRSMSNLIYTTLGVKQGFGLTSPNALVGILDLTKSHRRFIYSYTDTHRIFIKVKLQFFTRLLGQIILLF